MKTCKKNYTYKLTIKIIIIILFWIKIIIIYNIYLKLLLIINNKNNKYISFLSIVTINSNI